MLDTIHPHLLSLLRCPNTGQRLQSDGDKLVTHDGNVTYPVISGIPLLFSHSASLTHSGLSGLMDENARIVSDPRNVFGSSTESFVTNMLVPTCGNLFHGSSVVDDFPIACFPIDFPKGLVLDIGCNWGRWSIGGAAAGHLVVGVDPHLEALIHAKRLARRLCPQNEPFFVCCDARHMPFESDSFSGVFSYSVLQHFSRHNMLTIVDEIGRLLQTGGVSCIQMPNLIGIKALVDRICGRGPSDDEFNVRYYKIHELVSLYENHIGPSDYEVDCFLGLNVHFRDIRFVSGVRKMAVYTGSALKSLSNAFSPLRQLADSVFLISHKI